MIRLSIKGTVEQALLAANQRGIPLKEVEATKYSVVANTDEEHLVRVIHWYCEDAKTTPGEGFPPGTLLMHC